MLRKTAFEFVSAVGITMLVGASAVWAGDQKDEQADGGKNQGVAAKAIDLAEFRDRCLNPGGYVQQKQPQNIRIQCADSHYEYVATEPGYIPLAGSRKVLTTVLSDKFVAASGEPKEIPVYYQKGSCLRFKEIEKFMSVERAVSCDELLGMKDSVEDFCTGLIDSVKGKNPKMVAVRDTGKLIDSCAGVAGAGEFPGKDQQKKP